MGSPMMGGAYNYDEYACGRADIDVAETSHFCELIAEGDTNEDGEIVFIGTPNLVSLQEIFEGTRLLWKATTTAKEAKNHRCCYTSRS